MIRALPGRPRFLASVRSASEAGVALAGGADIIDAKEPAQGALGAVPLAGLAAILRETAGRRPVSATIGDCALADAPDRVAEIAAMHVDYVKIGIFGDAPVTALARLNQHAALFIPMPNSDRPVRSGGSSAGRKALAYSLGWMPAALSRMVMRPSSMGSSSMVTTSLLVPIARSSSRWARKLWTALSTNSAIAYHGL